VLLKASFYDAKQFFMPDTTSSSKTTFELVNQLIVAISQLLWPILVLIVIFIFRKELSSILSRLKKGKILGQELELEKEMNEFKIAADKVSETVVQESTQYEPGNTKVIENIFTKSSADPKVGILLLSLEIEKEVNKLIASIGILKEVPIRTMAEAFKHLEQRRYVAGSVVESLRLFWALRDKIIHGRYTESKDQLIRFIDIGTNLLTTLKSIPRQKLFVKKMNIELFSDANCLIKRPEVVGVILEEVNGITNVKSYKIVPTKNKHYTIGEELSSEYNNNTWNDTWYKDTDTNQIKLAWSGTLEFTGRPIAEYRLSIVSSESMQQEIAKN
jgi:hypothetical protein